MSKGKKVAVAVISDGTEPSYMKEFIQSVLKRVDSPFDRSVIRGDETVKLAAGTVLIFC